MARYYSGLTSRRRGRGIRWIFIISILLIISLSYLGYRIFSHHGRQTARSTPGGLTETNIQEQTAPVESEVAKAKEVAQMPAQEPKVVPGPPSDFTEGATEAAVEPNLKASELIAEAMKFLNAEPARTIDARDRLNEALPMPISDYQRAFVKKQLAKLADEWLFSMKIFPQDRLCESFKVSSGDLLSTIGKRFNVPYQILMEINGIQRPETLKAGDVIKVINGPFHARIYKSTFTMDVYLQNTFVRSFPVGLGQEGMETPIGVWLVKPGGKLISPTWTDPVSGKTYEAEDPDYPLGSRWIGLEGIEGQAKGRTGFAIHGTKRPEEIGTARSRGCIRLQNGDAVLVYNLLMPGLSRVEVVE